MIVSKCPECGQEILKPDPVKKTTEEKIQFRKNWDKRVIEGLNRDRK